MWLDAEINRNPELLENIINEGDVLRIAETINAQNDQNTLSRIRFELALGGNSGENPKESPSREPLIVTSFNVLDEKFLLDKRDTKIKSDLESLVKHLNALDTLINREDISEILVHSGQFTGENLKLLKTLICAKEEQVFFPLYDQYSYRKERNKKWGSSWTKLSFYEIFLEKTVALYTQLTGENFKSDFISNHYNIWEPTTEGTRFSYEFHKILNNFATSYDIQPFTNKNFKNTCNKIRTKINSL